MRDQTWLSSQEELTPEKSNADYWPKKTKPAIFSSIKPHKHSDSLLPPDGNHSCPQGCIPHLGAHGPLIFQTPELAKKGESLTYLREFSPRFD